MFDRMVKIRAWVALVWFLAFLGFILTMYTYLPKGGFQASIDQLETSVVQENWDDAKTHLNNLERKWMQSKFLIQINNATVDVFTFSNLLGKIEVLINHKEDDVIAQIGELKAIATSITTVFPGP